MVLKPNLKASQMKNSSKTVRVLCLHGWRTNKEVLRFQLSTGISAFLQQTRTKGESITGTHASTETTNRSSAVNFEFHCFDGPIKADEAADGMIFKLNQTLHASSTTKMASTGLGTRSGSALKTTQTDEPNKFYQWFEATRMMQPAGGSQTSQHGSLRYEGLVESGEYVLNYIKKHGRFDYLLGFSQGGCVVSYLSMALYLNPALLPSHLRWSTIVLCSTFLPRDEQIMKQFNSVRDFQGSERHIKSQEPRMSFAAMFNVVHLIGEKDFMKQSSENCREYFTEVMTRSKLSSNLSQSHGREAVVRFPEDHRLPSLAKSKKEIAELVTILHEVHEARERDLRENQIWCFDFDGVLCDSVVETGWSGLKTGQAVAPALFSAESLAACGLTEDELIKLFKGVRPMLETGFESTVLLYLCCKARKLQMTGECSDQASVTSVVAEMLRSKGMKAAVAEFCQEAELDVESLKTVFTKMRREWTETDLSSWLEKHSFFTQAIEAVKLLLKKEQEVYIITTKQKEFALMLLQNAGLGIDVLPAEKVFGLGSVKKHKVMKQVVHQQIQRTNLWPRVFFIEDRLSTLVQSQSAGMPVHCSFALASWGYNTEEHRAIAKHNWFQVMAQADLLNLVEETVG